MRLCTSPLVVVPTLYEVLSVTSLPPMTSAAAGNATTGLLTVGLGASAKNNILAWVSFPTYVM